MRQKNYLKEGWLYITLSLACLCSLAWSHPNSNTKISECAAAMSLIKICGGSNVLTEPGGTHGCPNESIEIEMTQECTGYLPMTIYFTNISDHPEEGIVYSLPPGVHDIHLQHEYSPGEYEITGPYEDVIYKGKLTVAGGEQIDIFGIDVWLYTTTTNTIGCTAGIEENITFPMDLAVLHEIDTDVYEPYPIEEFADPFTGVFSCKVFEETNCLCENQSCNTQEPIYDLDICMVCDCEGDRDGGDGFRLSADAFALGVDQVEVVPNPFRDNFVLNFSLATDQSLEYQIIDYKGQVLHRFYGDLARGDHQHLIHTSDFAPGMYFLQMVSDEQRISKKLIVVH